MPDPSKAWFEMLGLERPTFARSTWIPLRLLETTVSEPRWITGGWEEHFQVIGIEFPLAAGEQVSELDWVVAQRYEHTPAVEKDGWVPAGDFDDTRFEFRGRYPVLVLSTNGQTQWLLEQDLVLALGLLREGDVWVRPGEDFLQVAQLDRTDSGERLMMRAEHLRDYLCARESGLLLATYRSRKAVLAEKPDFGWGADDVTRAIDGGGEWRGSYHSVSAGGLPFGPWSVMRMSRHDPELDDDVPVLPGAGESKVRFEEGTYQPPGEPRTMVCGEFWRNEWVEPSSRSPRVRRDKVQSNIEFIVESDGTRMLAKHLLGGIRWLWFSPLIVGDVLEKRGGSLSWATEDTGGLHLVSHSPLHFGVNAAGQINVFAKDIALLPEHVQRLWAARNVTPDGKVSEELIAAQMRCDPAATRAPEVYLFDAEREFQVVTKRRFGNSLLKSHSWEYALLRRIHRFRCCETDGTYALCKDLTRFIIERLDVALLKKLVAGQGNLGSLKLLERLLDNPGADGYSVMGPLVACYDLRLADAHLPSADVDERLALLSVTPGMHCVEKGKRVIRSIADALAAINATLE